MRVLVGDDERLLADTIAVGLRRAAMAVDVCYDGDEAVARATVNRYDVAVLDPSRMSVHRDGQLLALSPKEYAVLQVLLRAGGAVVSTEELLEQAWDEHIDPFTNVVRVTVMTLRRKLGSPPVVHTVLRGGYRIGLEPDA